MILDEKPVRATQDSSVPVRLEAWGENPQDVEHAVAEAGIGWSRRTWDFVVIERHTGYPCPIDPDDPDAIAAVKRDGWAYAAYPYRAVGR
ncbi:MAG TPA: hypothetical protein VGS97_09710 [Actinocrinis sp.]|uniref:hypothetical protein n=1 Tax=Actinocrinis sp. TaxID=1920516 RepID=UPI002DDD7A47|nr:hypothetical protein [Actinocrinis sp.]HEV2344356.1 hypothetical protein [Actinocrinis sp.]